MLAIVWCLAVVAAGVWLGTIVFHGAIVAPTVFRSLSEGDASAFLRALFPRYYRLGIACGLLLSTSLVVVAYLRDWSAALLWQLAAALLMTGLTVYSLYLVPRINAARDAGAIAEQRFQSLHKRAVVLNMVILVLVFVVVVLASTNAPGVAS